jgi:DNA processing protein
MPSSSPDRAALRDLLALLALPGVGEVGVAERLGLHRSAREALAAESAAEADAAYQRADRQLGLADAIGAVALRPDDDAYPAALRELPDPPRVLWGRGRLATMAAPAVAIVGTREATPYGLRIATAIAARCARAGIAVISGLARGIDGAAHQAALDAGGRTVGVLGTGVDVVFPRTHRALQERVATEGLLLTELPPGAPGHGGTFPRRNRIIAALASLTVVVEAGERSGALITAGHAADLGRQVAVVPGPIDQPSARGSNALMRSGAHVLADVDDVLALLSIDASPVASPLLDGDAARCWDAIVAGARQPADIARRVALPVRAVTVALATLELEGLIVTDAVGDVQRAA